MTHERVIENYLIDMDGVLVHEERMIPGADRFIQALLDADRRFLILTNNSLYTPRGHYTRSKALTRYFVAMSVLGQTAFALPGALQNDLSRADDSGLRLASLAARTLVGDEKLEGLWREIYEPTAFLVGLSDDYTPFELATAIESAQPGTMADPAPLAQDATIDSTDVGW